MVRNDTLLWGASTAVQVGWVVNRVFLPAVAIALAATWIVPAFFERFLAQSRPAADVADALVGGRILMGIGIVMAIATDRLLTSLAEMLATAKEGDPFVLANAQRLQRIGWALVVLQLLGIPCAYLARYWPSLGSASPSGNLSLSGTIATLMVFVLARIFAAGAEMRDELAATV